MNYEEESFPPTRRGEVVLKGDNGKGNFPYPVATCPKESSPSLSPGPGLSLIVSVGRKAPVVGFVEP